LKGYALGGTLMLIGIIACAAFPTIVWMGNDDGMTHICDITDTELDEISGMAASRRHAGLLWVINDSGNRPQVYGISPEGQRRTTLRVTGARNEDWEDLAAFTRDGKHYLMVADIGDNDAHRRDCALYLLEEPDRLPADPRKPTPVSPTAALQFTYENGPRDCESAAVDGSAGRSYLISKREKPPARYELPLVLGATSRPLVARKILPLNHIPNPAKDNPGATGIFKYSGQPTAMDIASDGSHCLVMTYRNLCLYPRQPGEAWAKAMDRKPRIMELPILQQAEAACFDRDAASIYLTSEKLPAPIVQISLAAIHQ